jgi:UDP-N-acetylmuramoyl-tripeptide--D-alanyl-D-alanine ligase
MSALWNAHDLLEATGGAMATSFSAAGVSIDTRTLQPGDLFIALQGENGDGHRFVPDALVKGAAGAMVHQPIPRAANLLMKCCAPSWPSLARPMPP